MNNFLIYLIEFILGGSVIVGMDLLAKTHPKYAAVLYAVPLQFTLAAIFIYMGTEKNTIQNLSIYALYSLVVLMLFIGTFYLLTKRFDFWPSLVFSYILFSIGGLIVLKFI
ncbi:MAG: hypothetical protein KAS30_01915 [Candidatus Diapherotrites archaeon]|nr:hypothetical protein [Candidatus Diapherotrites archaeon]